MKNGIIAMLLTAGCLTISTGCSDNTPPPAPKKQKKSVKNNVATAYPAAVVKSYKKAGSQACLHNLKQLGMSLNMFVMDNNRFPAPDGAAGLQQLVEQQNFPTSLLCCPQKRPAALDENAIAFLYLGGTVGSGRNGKLPVAIEKPGRHGNQTAVLFSDGSVATYTVPGTYTSVTQVIDLCVPAGEKQRFKDAVKRIEK